LLLFQSSHLDRQACLLDITIFRTTYDGIIKLGKRRPEEDSHRNDQFVWTLDVAIFARGFSVRKWKKEVKIVQELIFSDCILELSGTVENPLQNGTGIIGRRR
jgi:hypothetical protein